MIVPGFPHHIVQRGHNRQPVFVERRDFDYYLANLQEWKPVYELEVFSYCLMTNHVHLVVRVNDNVTAILQLMKRLAGRQTRFVISLEKRSGSLWEGRYKISPVDTDVYLLACCRYVELNPVKAGMTDEPDTFRAMAGSYQASLEAYRQFAGQENSSPADELIRAAISSNKLTGGNKFEEVTALANTKTGTDLFSNHLAGHAARSQRLTRARHCFIVYSIECTAT